MTGKSKATGQEDPVSPAWTPQNVLTHLLDHSSSFGSSGTYMPSLASPSFEDSGSSLPELRTGGPIDSLELYLPGLRNGPQRGQKSVWSPPWKDSCAECRPGLEDAFCWACMRVSGKLGELGVTVAESAHNVPGSLLEPPQDSAAGETNGFSVDPNASIERDWNIYASPPSVPPSPNVPDGDGGTIPRDDHRPFIPAYRPPTMPRSASQTLWLDTSLSSDIPVALPPPRTQNKRVRFNRTVYASGTWLPSEYKRGQRSDFWEPLSDSESELYEDPEEQLEWEWPTWELPLHGIPASVIRGTSDSRSVASVEPSRTTLSYKP